MRSAVADTRARLDGTPDPRSSRATVPHLFNCMRPLLTWLKAFPASVLGTAWIKAMHGPFPQVRFVTTGGMNAANAAEFLRAGTRVVAIGSALQDPSQLPKLAALLEAAAQPEPAGQ
jgi:2-dehydro-3-deoxyphosphogluconate aldolase/(4S)-4-hydroxy-2-oxoglutarate aldolase